MRTLSLGLAVLAGMLVPSVAMSQDDIVGTLFGKATEIYKDKGYGPTGWEQRGELDEGAETRLTVKLSAGTSFSIVGVCDLDCGNLDIRLLDIGGNEVTKDIQDDDFPIVNVTTAGTYTARVIMVKCKSNPCAFGAKAFAE